MSEHHRGDIWLSETARHSQDGAKHKRPVLIVSKDSYNDLNDEVICLHLTTRLDHDYAIPLVKTDFEKSLLVDDSAVRYDSITRYSKDVLSKKLGILKTAKLTQVIGKTIELVK